ncbi:MAG TPA: exostosin family protein [Gaiellaceae bacterium]|nr:exostosin family protein [Gaiellaceae bacterium]
MNVLVATAGDHSWSRALRAEVEAVARLDRIGEHTLVADPGEAEVILFVDPHQHPSDWRQRALRRHPLVQEFPEKVFVYDERDLPRDSLPGVYVSMPRGSFDPHRHRAFAYYRLANDVGGVPEDPPDLLFSFQGRRVGPVRPAVLALSHPRAVVEDTSRYDFFGPQSPLLDDARRRYREVMGRSKFVLCPRGSGTGSFRLFEALACGRVPVVVSDDWVAPEGIAWETCSLRVPERDVRTIPGRLEALEPQWPELSTAAASVYREWFAGDVWFHRAVEHCRELRERGALGLRRQWLDRQMWRAGARHWKHTLATRRRSG